MLCFLSVILYADTVTCTFLTNQDPVILKYYISWFFLPHIVFLTYFLIGGKLQCCVCFCCTTTQISHNYVYPLPLELPTPQGITEPHAALLVLHSSFSPAIYFTHDSVYCQSYFLYSSHSLSPCVCKSVLYICISITPLKKIHQYHFSLFHILISVDIRYLFFSFWPTSLYNRLWVHPPH